MFWGWNIINTLRRGSGVVFVVTFLCVSMMSSSLSLAVLLLEYEQVLDLVASEERAIRPTAVSCDQLTGDICVTDAQYSNFHLFNKHGVEIFRTGGISGLSYPKDASLVPDGDFVFLGKNEHGVSTIRRLNFMGEPLEFTAEIPIEGWSPLHLTLMRDSNILTLDSYHGTLTKHDSKTGALLWLTKIVSDKSQELQLGRPVEAPDGRIYLPSGMLHNVIIFSEDGKQLETIGEFGTGPGKMVFPVGVAIGPKESILVLDSMRHKVLMFSKDHVLLGDFGSMGAGLGQFYHPSAIAASDNGKVYVAQGYDSRVQVFNIRNTKDE